MQLVCEQLVLGDCRRVGRVYQFNVNLSATLVGGLKDTYFILGRLVAVTDRPVPRNHLFRYIAHSDMKQTKSCKHANQALEPKWLEPTGRSTTRPTCSALRSSCPDKTMCQTARLSRDGAVLGPWVSASRTFQHVTWSTIVAEYVSAGVDCGVHSASSVSFASTFLLGHIQFHRVELSGPIDGFPRQDVTALRGSGNVCGFVLQRGHSPRRLQVHMNSTLRS